MAGERSGLDRVEVGSACGWVGLWLDQIVAGLDFDWVGLGLDSLF